MAEITLGTESLGIYRASTGDALPPFVSEATQFVSIEDVFRVMLLDDNLLTGGFGGLGTMFSGCGISVFDDGSIPAGATINSVTFTILGLGFYALLSANDTIDAVLVSGDLVRSRTRMLTGPAGVSTPTVTSVVIPTDHSGNAWTRSSIFGYTYGIVCTNLSSEQEVNVAEMRVIVDFSQVAPTGFVTANPTNIGPDRATLNASLNPQGATSAYPISVYFRLYEDGSLLTTTIPQDATGSSTITVSSQALGLKQNHTYEVQAVAEWDGGNVLEGALVEFTTPLFNGTGRIF